MAISYPRTLPTTPGIKTNRFGLIFENSEQESPLDRTLDVQNAYWGRWEGLYTMPPMSTAQARAWVAWFATMHGGDELFFGFDPDGRDPAGIADTGPDAPIISAADQTGISVTTSGWRNNGTGLLLPGDYIQLSSSTTAELKIVTEQVDSDGGGLATIAFEPPIRTAPAISSSVVFNDPVGAFRLIGSQTWRSDEMARHGFSFAIEEAA